MILNELHKYHIKRYTVLSWSLFFSEGYVATVEFETRNIEGHQIEVSIFLAGQPQGKHTNWLLGIFSENDAQQFLPEASAYRDEIVNGLAKVLEP